MYWCRDNVAVRVERNVITFYSVFTHLKCQGADSRPGNLVGVRGRQLILPRGSTIFNVLRVVSNTSSYKLNHYLELYFDNMIGQPECVYKLTERCTEC